MKRAGAVLTPGLATLAVMASSAVAAPYKVCVPEKASAAIVTPVSGSECKPKDNPALLPTAAEEEVLQHMSFTAKGIDEKPTIVISGVNVQIDSGAAKEEEVNGLGNLIVGNNANPFIETGSDNIGLGSTMTFTGFGGLVSGEQNTVEGAGAVSIGGFDNVSTTEGANVGGAGDFAQLLGVTVGGENNQALGPRAVVAGGIAGRASAAESSIFGGGGNKATGLYSSVFGGGENEASANRASVAGGHKLKAINELEPLL